MLEILCPSTLAPISDPTSAVESLTEVLQLSPGPEELPELTLREHPIFFQLS